MSMGSSVLRIRWPLWAGFAAMVLGLLACQPQERAPATPLPHSHLLQTAMAGSDRDEKGCIGSAGFVWSPLQSRCLRVFEEGLAFAPAGANRDPGQLAFVLINRNLGPDTQSAVAELYWPGQAEPIALRRTRGHDDTLLQDTKGLVLLVRQVSDYQILFKGQRLFERPMHISERLTALR